MIRPTNINIETILQLQEEILRCRHAAIYFENKAMRIELTLAELSAAEQSDERGFQAASPAEQSGGSEPRSAMNAALQGGHLSLREMVERVLPEMNGSTFHYDDLKNKLVSRFPDQTWKIKRNIYVECNKLFKRGALLRVDGGMVRAEHRETA